MTASSGNPSMSCNTQVITMDTFKKFLETRQMEPKSENEIKMVIEVIDHLLDSLRYRPSNNFLILD